ncbi:MAG: hypothetical protein HUK02_01580 [Bacteroidaceae bacterium]|nr:hypothetical protein [Bacteroidaceae bacterium]
MSDERLLKIAIKLVGLLDKQADQTLPRAIADVVKTHSKLAVGSAWIPVPGLDAIAGATTIWTMYTRINGKLGVSLKDNVLKTIASGVATNLASYAAMTGAASALKFIPFVGSLGGAVIMSASLYAITLASGWVYLKALCALAEKSGPELDMSQLGDAVKEVLKDSSIKSFINEAKSEYKK